MSTMLLRIGRAMVLALAVCVFLGRGLAQTNGPADTAKWEKEISAFEASDKTNPPPKHAILFVGSSSIRIWKTLAKDFPGKPVFNRGFGGSHIADSVALADRIILPYQPKQIVFYAGDNDLAAGKSADQVFADYEALVKKVHAALPETRILFISIKPSPSRRKYWDKIREVNRRVAALKADYLDFVDVYTPMLGPDGKGREELFTKDMLHMNAKGYAIWTQLIGPKLVD